MGKLMMLIPFILVIAANSAEDAYYCNGDIVVVSGDSNDFVKLNAEAQGFVLDPVKHEVIHLSLDGKNQLIKVLPYQSVKWEKVSAENLSRFKFTTNRKTWFAAEFAKEEDDTLRYLFCQRD